MVYAPLAHGALTYTMCAGASAEADIERRVAALELRSSQRTDGSPLAFSPTTLTATYSKAVDNGTVQMLQRPTWFGAAQFPDAALPEALPPGTRESDVQRQFEERTALALASAARRPTLRLVGSSTTPSIGTRKPDIVGLVVAPAVHGTGENAVVEPVSNNVTHICVLGDLKPRRAEGKQGRFAEQEKAQVLGFAEELVRRQPWRGHRARVVAFLCDGAHVVFFECEFQAAIRGQVFAVELVSALESGSMPLAGEGGGYLAGLTVAPLAKLGYTLPNNVALAGGQPVEVHEYLGMGGTATGFRGSCGGRAVVLKCYHPRVTAVAAAEEAALRALSGAPGVCQLVGVSAGGDLVLEPAGAFSYALHAPAITTAAAESRGLWSGDAGSSDVAQPPGVDSVSAAALRPRAADYCDLLSALAQLHARGWVHRDPRPCNFFRTRDGRFVLADLGSAVRVGERAAAEVAWAFPYGPIAALRALAYGTPRPAPAAADDLEQVARLVYITSACYSVPLSGEPAMLAFWEAVGPLEPLASLLAAAEADAAGDSGALQRCIRRVLL